MTTILAVNIALSVLVVYLGANLAMLARPRSVADILSRKNNRPNPKKQWLITVAVSFGVVGFMSIMLAIIAHPEWFEWLERVLEPINRWLESFITSTVLTLLSCAVLFLFTVFMSASIKDDLKRLGLKGNVCINAVIIGEIALAANFNNWITANLLAVLVVIYMGIALQQRVSFLKLAVFMNILAFAYDFVQVYLTGNMVKAASNMAPGMPGTEHPKTHQVVSSLNFPSVLHLPTEWALQPASSYILGLGDVLTGILMAAGAARLGKLIKSKLPLLLGVAGFGLGVYSAFGVFLLTGHAQPALIFIAPAISLLVIGYMWIQGHTAELNQKPWVPDTEPQAQTA